MLPSRTGLSPRWAFALGLVPPLIWTLGFRDPPLAPLPGPPPDRSLASEWSHPDGTGGGHFSPLEEIDSRSAPFLEVAWVYRTGDVSHGPAGEAGTAFQSTPLMVDGTLYIATPFSRVIALDPETGAERWRFDPGVDRTDSVHTTVTNRGVSTWVDAAADPGDPCRRRIFLAAYDARLFALDAATGRPCAGFGDSGQVDLSLQVDRDPVRR